MPSNEIVRDFINPTAQSDAARSQLQKEVDATNQLRKRESLLSRGITEMLGVRKAGDSLNAPGLNRTTQEMLASMERNRADRLWEQDVTELGTGLLKTGCLFLKGRTAFLATAVVFALDEIKPGSSVGEMLLDGTLGAAKGVATRETLHWATNQGWSPGKVGLVLGGSGRLVDSAMSRGTYSDSSGKFDLGLGVSNIAKTTLNPLSMASDYAVFSFSHAALGKLDGLTGGRIANNPFWRTVATGESIGLSSGLVGESMRQYHEGEFDPARIIKMGLAKGALDGIAAMPGGFQASRMAVIERGSQPLLKQQELLVARPDVEAVKTEVQKPGEFNPAQRESVVESMALLKDGPAQPGLDFRNWAERNLEQRNVPAVQYNADGVRIVVPIEYDNILGQLRQWRAGSAKTGVTEMPREHPLYEYRDRALPEDVADAIRRTPDSKLISKVRLLDQENPQGDFIRQTDPEHQSAMASNRDRVIELYKPEKNWLFNQQFGHEWWHIAKWEMPEHSYRFDLASNLERNGFFADQYGRKGVEENWATHASSELASDNASRAAAFAYKAPLRSAALLSAAREALDNTDPSVWGPQQRILDRNVTELLPKTLERSREQLRDTINKSSEPEDIEAATKLLLHYGQPADFAQITRPIDSLTFIQEPLSSRMIENMTHLPGVRNLTFNTTHIEPDAYQQLASVRNLRTLTLNGMQIEDYDLRRLANSLGRVQEFESFELLNYWANMSEATRRAVESLKR